VQPVSQLRLDPFSLYPVLKAPGIEESRNMQYAFADCVLDTEGRELRRAGVPVKLEPKVYQVLVYLVQHADRVVTREELLDQVWPEVYVAPTAVARCITSIRQAVGDRPEAQQVIQTRHGQGYRFVAPLAVYNTIAPPAEGGQVSSGPPAPQVATLEHPSSVSPPLPASAPPPAARPALAVGQVALLYMRHVQPDAQVLQYLEMQLSAHGYRVFIDRHLALGVEWAKEIEHQVRSATAVIPLLSAASVHSEMLAYEVELAYDAAQRQAGRPRLLPVRINFPGRLPEALARILDPLQAFCWERPQDNRRLVMEVLQALQHPAGPTSPLPHTPLEPPGGAMAVDSQFYVVRPPDEAFHAAIARHDSIVLVKGARQMGKTSLLARGLQQARDRDCRVVLSDFQKLNTAHLAALDTLYLTLGGMLAEQLDLEVFPEGVWQAQRGPNGNFERYVQRQVLGTLQAPLVWGLDEVDRLFTYPFGNEVFGLFRAWHNERALDPQGPWGRLTLAIAYATEAHLFITDPHQSPFNVGTRLTLEDFTYDQVADLNRRYGSPLRNAAEVERLFRLVGGQPYLVRRGLHELVTQHLTIAALADQAAREEGLFGDHLRRLLVLLAPDAALCEAVREVLQGRPCPDYPRFYRLRSAGVLAGESPQDARPRCQLYATYLERHL
jgi:DNA-binding winged helix-turn-helix (wHTH) protein